MNLPEAVEARGLDSVGVVGENSPPDRSGTIITMESMYEFTLCGGAVLLLCVYSVFMLLHLVAIVFG